MHLYDGIRHDAKMDRLYQLISILYHGCHQRVDRTSPGFYHRIAVKRDEFILGAPTWLTGISSGEADPVPMVVIKKMGAQGL